jgi:hypothetical protein
MSLLEKASGGKKGKNANSRNRTSLFQRAMAASSPEGQVPGRGAEAAQPLPSANAVTIDASIDAATIEAPIAAPTAVPVAINSDSIDHLKDKLHALHPAQDATLAAWSLVSTGLPFKALSLFLPSGDFLALAAQIGFPSGKSDDIPISIAPSPDRQGSYLENEAKALVAPVLGVSVGLPLRAVSMLSETGLMGMWIFHDDAFETWPEDARARVSEFLADVAGPHPRFDITVTSPDPASAILPKLARYPYAAAVRYDLGSTYSERSACRGLTAGAIRSAFSLAFAKILDQTGAVLAFGDSSVVGFLGASSRLDPELSLFQFSKSLKRSLPFLSAEAFPIGVAMGFDLSSDLSSEELARFLS